MYEDIDMFECVGSDRIIALQVANDILSKYAEYAHQEAEEYTSCVMILAETFIDWAEQPLEKTLEKILPEFFN